MTAQTLEKWEQIGLERTAGVAIAGLTLGVAVVMMRDTGCPLTQDQVEDLLAKAEHLSPRFIRQAERMAERYGWTPETAAMARANRGRQRTGWYFGSVRIWPWRR